MRTSSVGNPYTKAVTESLSYNVYIAIVYLIVPLSSRHTMPLVIFTGDYNSAPCTTLGCSADARVKAIIGLVKNIFPLTWWWNEIKVNVSILVNRVSTSRGN